jgi:hypothetical protein
MNSDDLSQIRKLLIDYGSRIEKLEGVVFKSEFVKSSEAPTEIVADLDVGSLSFLKNLKSARDKSLAVLDQLLSKNPKHGGLTPDGLARIFKEKFGLPVPLPTISSELYRASGRYVTRTRVAGKPTKYRYQILPKGQDYIRSKIANLQTDSHASNRHS